MNFKLLIIVLGALLIAGCGLYNSSGKNYPKYEARTAFRVFPGEVVSVREVHIDGVHTRVGTYGGAAIGYSVGRTVGGGSGTRVAGAVGGVAGAVAGRAIETAATAERGLEITIELDNGDVIAVVQAADQVFEPGEPVRVLMGYGSARVSKI